MHYIDYCQLINCEHPVADDRQTKKINVTARLILAAVLIVWTGSNFFVNAIFNFKAIVNAEDRVLSVLLALVAIAIPLAIAAWLLQSVSKAVTPKS